MPRNEDSLVEVDELRLDKELKDQPRRYLTAARELAESRKDYAEAKALFDLVKAELYLSIRKNPTNYISGIVKPTESVIEAVVITNARYKNAQQAMIDAKHQMDLAAAVVDALEHRKKTLEGMVYLQGQGYFAAPRDLRNRRTEKMPPNRRKALDADDDD